MCKSRLAYGRNMGPENTPMPAKKTGENRRSNKPIMEKRRRARINSCLNELKNLILDAMKKDPARHSKLEKADILEMTVRHLESLQRQRVAMLVASDPSIENKFQAGYDECVNEVKRYMNKVDGVNLQTKQRLLSHLTSGNMAGAGVASSVSGSGRPVLPIVLPTGSVQLVPTRLPNGDFAFVLPAQEQKFVIQQECQPDTTTSAVSTAAATATATRTAIVAPSCRPEVGLDLSKTGAAAAACAAHGDNADVVCHDDEHMWRPW